MRLQFPRLHVIGPIRLTPSLYKAIWKSRPTPHYSVERHLNLNGRDTSLIWTYSQVGRKCCFHSQRTTLHAPRSRYTVGAGDDSKRVTRVSQFTTVEQERERKIERLGKRQALYTRLYFPRGFRSRNYGGPLGPFQFAHYRCRPVTRTGFLLRAKEMS